MNYIQDEVRHFPTILLQIEYGNKTFKEIIKEDIRKYNIGLLMLSKIMFKNKVELEFLLEFKIPIFKTGRESLKAVKSGN